MIKDKEQTKRKLIEAVGKVIKTDGFSNLKISKVAKTAEVDRKLIYRYFGGLNYLIEAYILENDYWMVFAAQMKIKLSENTFDSSKDLIISILQNQFRYFLKEKDMQQLILWELSSKSPLMKSIHNARETMGQQFLELTDSHFKDSKVNFRAIAALLVGGIYYTILHTMFNGSKFADLDVDTDQGQEEILNAISQVVEWAYKDAAINE